MLDIGHRHQTTGQVAVETRAFVVLDLEQLEQADLLGGRTHDAEPPRDVGQQDARSRDVEQLDTTRRQHGEHVDDIEVGHEGVDDLDERGRRQRLTHERP